MRRLVAVSVILGYAWVAHAQAGVEAARTHYRAGAAYYGRGLYEDAIREFTSSYELSRKPDILYNLAQCNDKLGRRPQVIRYLRQYLDEKPQAEDRAQVGAWLRHLEEAEAQARSAAAHAAKERAALERQAATARAAPPGGAAPPRSTDADLAPGRRRLRIVLSSVAAGVAVVGLALGAGFGWSAKSKNDASGDHCRAGNLCDAEGVALRRDALTAGNVSTAGFVVAGVALVGAGVAWLTLRPGRAEVARRVARIEAAPALSPTGAALLLRGRW